MRARGSSSASATAVAEAIRKPALSQLHSETSNAAARRIEPTRETLQAKVLECIRAGRTFVTFAPKDDDPTMMVEIARRQEPGATDEEIAATLSMNPSTARPRRVELVEANLVYDSGLTRRTRSGRRATVWIAR